MITRYETPEMRAVWSNQRKLEIWQEIEILVCEVRAERGEMPVEAARNVACVGGRPAAITDCLNFENPEVP